MANLPQVFHTLVFSFVLTSTPLVLTVAAQQDQIPNAGHPYPVHIGAEGHIVQGRVSSEADVGALVPSNVIFEGDEDANKRVHLRVEVRDSIYKRPHVYHPDIKINTSDPGNPQFEHPVIDFNNSTLPYGMEFVVVHTNAFYVNEDRFIVVNDLSNLEGERRIHFDVILKDKLAETHYVSNQLPFVVEIDYPVRKPNPNAALFAGVLILTIVAISLLIPFVVRAKRRSKAGKPICGCGSADDGSDSDSTGSVPDYVKNRAMSIGGKDNLAMILDSGRMMHRPSVDQHTTIQNHMLRSTSNMNFQPHWLDPHYSEVYERPDFTRARPMGQQHQQANGGYNNGLGLARGNSNRSSMSSNYNYPANFNSNMYTKADRASDLPNGAASANGSHSQTTSFGSKTANGGVASISKGKLDVPKAPEVTLNGVKVSDGGAVGGASASATVGEEKL